MAPAWAQSVAVGRTSAAGGVTAGPTWSVQRCDSWRAFGAGSAARAGCPCYAAASWVAGS